VIRIYLEDTPVGRGGGGGNGLKKKWQFHSRVDDDFYVYHRSGVCAPLVVGHIPIKRTKLQSDSLLCNMRYASPAQIPHTAERLRYFRCQKNLYQADVADHCGIDRSTYISYEDCARDAYPLDKLAKIAEFLQVDIVDLLDNYNRFIYEGQGQGLKAFRRSRHMTQAELGRMLQTTQSTVKRWEQGQIQMSRRKWERMNEMGACSAGAGVV